MMRVVIEGKIIREVAEDETPHDAEQYIRLNLADFGMDLRVENVYVTEEPED
jgi:hypothetical protein